jgi:hypothetical protein
MNKIRISLALFLFTFMTLWTSSVFSAEPGTLILQKTFPTNSGDRLKVNAYAGNVKINCWGKNEIEIKIYGSSEAVKYLDFNVSSDEFGIIIAASKKTGIENAKSLGLRYEISVPHSYCVKVTGGKNVTIDKDSAPVEVSNK